MKLRILAFGIAKDIFESSDAELELDAGATVANLKQLLEEKYPRLKQIRSFMLAVNNEYADADRQLIETDEIALIPPVSGG